MRPRRPLPGRGEEADEGDLLPAGLRGEERQRIAGAVETHEAPAHEHDHRRAARDDHTPDGDDPDWASWYADWLLDHSELPQLLGAAPVRSHLVAELVALDRGYTAETREERWEDWYAGRLLERFGTA